MLNFILFLASPIGAIVWPIGCLLVMITVMTVFDLLGGKNRKNPLPAEAKQGNLNRISGHEPLRSRGDRVTQRLLSLPPDSEREASTSE